MKISKKQRKENIEAVFKAVIKLSKDRGFDSLTMKSIAKEAGIGEATIYNYFPKKETLISGYFDWSIEEAINRTQKEPLKEMSFTDIFHTLIENHLEVLTPAKSFFADSVQSLFTSPISLANTSLASIKNKHSLFLADEFSKSVAKGDFPQPPFKDFLVSLMWDYHIGVLYYWLKDSSKSSLRTTEFIALSMKVFEELLGSDLFNKIYAVAHFLFKEHVLNKLLNPKGIPLEE
ncbi:MAG: TetR/AcrR family transcriptional regulator [Bdellovibrionaceae bacterium]|nr:TetR/AcrR family transcriptional regulator [Pseudobdellovibrionaceae bacterium]